MQAVVVLGLDSNYFLGHKEWLEGDKQSPVSLGHHRPRERLPVRPLLVSHASILEVELGRQKERPRSKDRFVYWGIVALS